MPVRYATHVCMHACMHACLILQDRNRFPNVWQSNVRDKLALISKNEMHVDGVTFHEVVTVAYPNIVRRSS